MGDDFADKHTLFRRSALSYQAHAAANLLQVSSCIFLGLIYRSDAFLLDNGRTFNSLGKSFYANFGRKNNF